MTESAPLAGVLVADFSRVLAGPLATMTLADLGARVVKVERPGAGDDTRSWGPPHSAHGATYFESVNRSKESIALDLRDAADLAVARELCARADVVVENFSAGTMDRLGLGYDELRAANPALVYCSITGFGRGEGADLLGYDFVVQAVGGLMSITGAADGDPTKVGVALVDVLTGKDATIAILAALQARERTGLGDRVEVTLLTSLLGGLVNQGQAYLEHGVAPTRMGNEHPSIVPYETLRCRDALIAVACGNDAQFRRLAATLGVADLGEHPDYEHNSDRVANRRPLVAALEAATITRDAADWVGLLNAAKVPAGKVADIGEAVEFAERLGLAPTVELPAGHTRQIRHPICWTRHAPTTPTAPPRLDEHGPLLRDWLAGGPACAETGLDAADHTARPGAADHVAAGHARNRSIPTSYNPKQVHP